MTPKASGWWRICAHSSKSKNRLVLAWTVAYLTVIAVWTVIIRRRSSPTLWKGSSLAVVNGVFIVATIVWMLTRRPTRFDTGILLFDVALVSIAVLLGGKWFLFGIDRAASVAILERCLKQTRSTATSAGNAHVVQCGDTELSVVILPTRGLSAQRVIFGAAKSRKAVLIRSLFSKQFERSFPTPRFRA
jgi:heme/copper-type cytochrome/quinol oxidase subunit 4